MSSSIKGSWSPLFTVVWRDFKGWTIWLMGRLLFSNNLSFLWLAYIAVAGGIHQEQWMKYAPSPNHHCQIRVWSTREKKTDNKLTGLVFLHSGKLKIKYSAELSKRCVIIINIINAKSYCQQTNYYPTEYTTSEVHVSYSWMTSGLVLPQTASLGSK